VQTFSVRGRHPANGGSHAKITSYIRYGTGHDPCGGGVAEGATGGVETVVGEGVGVRAVAVGEGVGTTATGVGVGVGERYGVGVFVGITTGCASSPPEKNRPNNAAHLTQPPEGNPPLVMESQKVGKSTSRKRACTVDPCSEPIQNALEPHSPVLTRTASTSESTCPEPKSV